MREFKTEHQDRATAILKSVEGLSIAEAQWLLEWCSAYLEENAALEVEIPRRQDKAAWFIKSYQDNRSWLLDLYGQEELVESIADDIAEVLEKHNLSRAFAASYRAAVYALQRMHLARFSDFLC